MDLRSAAKRKAVEPVQNSSDGSEHEPEMEQKNVRLEHGAQEKFELPSEFSKCFALEHVFKDVLTWAVGSFKYSRQMEHFGVKWFLRLQRNENHVHIFICRKKIKSEKIEIDVRKMDMNTTSFHLDRPKNGKTGLLEDECSDAHLYGEFPHRISLTEQDVSVKCVVEILHSEGLIERTEHFDEQKRDVSDATIILNGEHFFVAKLYLATHSTTFHRIFVGNRTDDHHNLTINGIERSDLQAYLDVLYGYKDIEENTVEGLILIGKGLQTDIILEKCQKFLMDKSVKALRTKFEISIRHKLDDLMSWCFDNMDTHHDVKMCVPEDLTTLAPGIMVKLLQKSLSFA